MTPKQIEIAKAIGNFLWEKYDWNVFGSLHCGHCEEMTYSGKFCAKCGTKLVAKPDEEVCKELYEAYCKGKEVENGLD